GVGTGADPNTGSATSQLEALRSRVGALESVTPGGITAYSATLPTLSQPASSAYVDWGTAIQIPNPGYEVIVMAWLSGFVLNDGQGTQNRLRVTASLNGSTWVDGANAVDQAGGGASTRRGGMTAIYMTRGVPTTDIAVKGQAWWSGSGGTPSFYEGYLTVLVIPAGDYERILICIKLSSSLRDLLRTVHTQQTRLLLLKTCSIFSVTMV